MPHNNGQALNGAPPNGLVRAAPTYGNPAYGIDPYAPNYGMPTGPYGPGGDSSDVGSGAQSLRRFGQILKRRKKIIAATLLAVFAGTYFLGRSQKEVFVSSATMRAVSNSRSAAPSSAGDPLGIIEQMASGTSDRRVESQLVILQSPQLMAEAMKRIGPNERKAIRNVSMDGKVGTSDLIDVNVTAATPDAAEHFANVVCNTYINRTLQANRNQLAAATDYARKQRDTVGAKLKSARERLRTFQERSGFVSASAQTSSGLGQLQALQAQIEATTRDHAAIMAQLQSARARASVLPIEELRSSQIVTRPEVTALRNRIIELEKQRSDLIFAQGFREDAPQVRDITEQLNAARAQLAREPKTEEGLQMRGLNAARAALDGQISSLTGQLADVDARQSKLREQIGRVRIEVARVPGLGQQLSALQGEVDTHSRDFQALNDRYTQLQMSQQAKLPDATLLFSSSPATAVAQNRKRNLILAAALGLVLALALAALADWMDDRVHNEEEAKNALQLPVLAQVPMMNGRESPALTHASLPSPQLENFRMLRTLVAFSPLPSPARSVLLTSSLPGEGKSVCAANFAIAAALSGERVILIDGDLRRPTQHELFSLPNDIGFSSVASGRVALREALVDTRTPGLRLLPGGPVEPNPFTLLNGPQGRAAIREAMELADLVVVDSPPALLFADAQLLASETDAVLLVVSSRDVGRREIARTRALLAQTGTRPVGIVLNKLGGEADTHDKYAAKYYSRYNLNGQNGSSNNGSSNNGLSNNGLSNGHAANGTARALAPTASRDEQ